MNNQETNGIYLLCDELLFEIFQYTGKYHQSIRLTCKKFNKIICELEKNKFQFKITNEMLDNVDVYNSMINSNRIFNEIRLETNKLEKLLNYFRLRNIFFIKGANITKLSWDSCKMTQIEVITLLNLLPNLECLQCNLWKLENEYYDGTTEFFNLSQLKRLKINRSNKATHEFFINFLPDNILANLSTDFDPCTFLKTQREVKELDINVEELSPAEINFPKLSKLTMMLRKYKSNDLSILHSILPIQNELTYLNLLKCEGIFDSDDASFVNMCSISSLKILKINVDNMSKSAFLDNFNKLEGLEELEIESVEHNFTTLVDIIEDFSNMIFIRLKVLKIDIEFLGIPLDRIEKMSKNLPNLKRLELRCDLPLPLEAFLKNFKGLDSIKIDYHYTREFSSVCNGLNEKSNTNIKSLYMEGFRFGSEINSNETSFVQLIKALPNLENLDIDIDIKLNSKLLTIIPTKLLKLKSIKNLYFVQSGDNYEKFDFDFVKKLVEISEKIHTLSIEFKLKCVDMDVSFMKEFLSKQFKFLMSKHGSFVIIKLSK